MVDIDNACLTLSDVGAQESQERYIGEERDMQRVSRFEVFASFVTELLNCRLLERQPKSLSIVGYGLSPLVFRHNCPRDVIIGEVT